MTAEEAARLMESYVALDQETSHIQGDDLLCEIIREHLPEFIPVLEYYENVGKWYA